MGLKRFEKPPDDAGSGSTGAPLGAILERWPNVHSFLTELRWPDGSSRSTGTVMVFTEASAWKAYVHDRDAQVSAFCSAGTLEDLLERVNQGLEDGGLDWRPDKQRKR